MKKRSVIIALASLTMMVFTHRLSAQQNLEKWFEKQVEVIDPDVQVTVVNEKFRDTNKPDSRFIRIHFPDDMSSEANRKLIEEFHRAYEKDKDAAYITSEDRHNGKMYPSPAKFSVKEKDGTDTEINVIFYHVPAKKHYTAIFVKIFDYGNRELEKKRSKSYQWGG